METYERLQHARKRAGFETAQDAADRFGWNAVTYRAHEAGDRGLKIGVAEKYAKAFKVSQSWLLTGQGDIDGQAAEIIDIWSRIPDANRSAARQMLESLAKKNS